MSLAEMPVEEAILQALAKPVKEMDPIQRLYHLAQLASEEVNAVLSIIVDINKEEK